MNYPGFVIKDKIESKGSNGYRFLLSIPFQCNFSNHQTLFVILKNPSKATTQFSDLTVTKVCNVAYNNGYSQVMIFNLFPYRSTKAKGLLNFFKDQNYNSIMRINLNIILNYCIGNDTVFAWGTNTISKSKINTSYYNNAILGITKSLKVKTYYVGSCKCKNKGLLPCSPPNHDLIRYPLHGQRWSYSMKLIKY